MTTTTSPQAATPESRVAGWITPNEIAILEAICDTLLPPLEPPAGSAETITAYYRRSARDLNIAHLVAETLAQENLQAQTEFRQLLALLASPAAGLLLAGSPRPFIALSQEKREQYPHVCLNRQDLRKRIQCDMHMLRSRCFRQRKENSCTIT